MIVHQTEGTIANPQVLPLSALMALYGRQILSGNITEESLDDCLDKYLMKFKEKVVENGAVKFTYPSQEELAEKLIVNSDVEQLENEVIFNTFKEHPPK